MEQDSSPTGVTLKIEKDPFTRKGLIFVFAKRPFIIAKLFEQQKALTKMLKGPDSL